jgi:hypothetical protein
MGEGACDQRERETSTYASFHLFAILPHGCALSMIH